MGRKPRVDRSPEEKWQIVQEGIKSGNVSETCRRHGIAANLFYRWKDEAEQGAKAALSIRARWGGVLQSRSGKIRLGVGRGCEDRPECDSPGDWSCAGDKMVESHHFLVALVVVHIKSF
jgi:transposase-like protein